MKIRNRAVLHISHPEVLHDMEAILREMACRVSLDDSLDLKSLSEGEQLPVFYIIESSLCSDKKVRALLDRIGSNCIPIVVFTDSHDDGEIPECIELLNPRGYLFMPLSPFALKLTLQSALRQYQTDLLISQQRIQKEFSSFKENNARKMLDSSHKDLIVMLDKDGCIIDCNKAYAMRVQKTYDELIGISVWKLVPSIATEKRRELFYTVFKRGEAIQNIDERDGYISEYSMHPLFLKNGAVSHVVVYIRDITESEKLYSAVNGNE